MTLLEEIRKISLEAANILEGVDCCTDSEIRTLTQHDLQELLPGLSNFRIRKKIYETIQKKRPIHVVLSELKSFIPDEFLQDALSSNGALHEYLQSLKTLKVEMGHVQEFLDAQINLLEKYGPNPDIKSSKDQALKPSVSNAPVGSSASSTGAVITHHMEHMDRFSSQKAPNAMTNHMDHNFLSSKAQAPSLSSPYGLYNSEAHRRSQIKTTVRYKMVVSGNTLERHLDVMRQIKSDLSDSLTLQETRYDEDSNVIIVFCPVVSRAGTDVERSLQEVSDVKPVILVLMHHSRNVQTSAKVKSPNHDVVLVVNVYFHETSPGLLKCRENDEANVSIQAKLKFLST